MISPVNPLSFAVAFLVFAFANYGIATMLADGRGPLDLFERWRRFVYDAFQMPHQRMLDAKSRAGHVMDADLPFHWIYDGITCPVCLSFWFAIPFAFLLTQSFYLSPFEFLAIWLALHGAARLIYKQERH